MSYESNSQSGAIISPCQRYRYRLWRVWNPDLPPLCFVMLNPSTADASQDDPTIRKCVGFAKRLGFGAIEVANLFAWRATYPEELLRADDPVGPTNDAAIRNAAETVVARGGQVVCAWGANGQKHPARVQHVRELLLFSGIPAYVLRLSKTGAPWHPLMLPYSCELKEWEL